MIIAKLIVIMITVLFFCLYFVVPLMKQNTFDFIIFGIPWAIFLVSTTYPCASTVWFHTAYFYLNCLYLKTLMKHTNSRFAKRMSTNSLARKLVKMNETLCMIYDRRNASRFWSQAVPFMVTILIGMIVFNTYQTLFNNTHIFLTFVYSQCVLVTVICLSVFILSAAQVNAEISKSYLLLNRICTKYQVQNLIVKLKVRVI